MKVMFIKAGPNEAVSFTDDTSPDTRNTKKRNVSIHAKVSRKTPLTWYYDLLFACRHINGELKSKDAVEAYKHMRRYERTNLWDTLKEVQINITDPLPYQADVNNILKQALQRDDAVNIVRQRAIAKDPFAIGLLEKLNNHTAERILLDAPSKTLSWSIYFSQRYAGGTASGVTWET